MPDQNVCNSNQESSRRWIDWIFLNWKTKNFLQEPIWEGKLKLNQNDHWKITLKVANIYSKSDHLKLNFVCMTKNETLQRKLFDKMSIVVKTLIFFQILGVVLLLSNKGLKITSYRCTSSNKSIHPGYKCFAKSLSRKVSTANFFIKLRRPFFNMMVNLTATKNGIVEFKMISIAGTFRFET